jgi:hypothetical protein
MQNCAPPPERAQEHGNVLLAGFTPVPNTYAATVDQAGGFIFLDQLSRENHLFELRDNPLPTSVPARNTHCSIINTTKLVLSWCRAPFFHKVQMSVSFCVNVFIFYGNSYMQQDSDTKTLSLRAH